MIELLSPDFMKKILETLETIANALQNITRAGFDDLSRLRVRTEYIDDGYVRVRDTSASIDILEMLREFSWTFYNLAELNKLLSNLRWGRDVTPVWIHTGEVTAPAANTALVSKTVSAGKRGYIYGFFISAGEANDFKINWTSGGTSYSIRIPLGGKGYVHYADFIALNEGLGADAGTSITITNVNAGSSGVIYQARLLYAEI